MLGRRLGEGDAWMTFMGTGTCMGIRASIKCGVFINLSNIHDSMEICKFFEIGKHIFLKMINKLKKIRKPDGLFLKKKSNCRTAPQTSDFPEIGLPIFKCT